MAPLVDKLHKQTSLKPGVKMLLERTRVKYAESVSSSAFVLMPH
jgi:hypothetical protein